MENFDSTHLEIRAKDLYSYATITITPFKKFYKSLFYMKAKEKLRVILFYKFVELEELETLKNKHLNFMNDLGVRGRILLGKEGINGSISGNKKQIQKYKTWLKCDKKFSNMSFKEETCIEHPFRKNTVTVRDEIVTIGKKVDMNNKGKYITAKELKKIYENGLKDTVILDARNNYEHKIGHFKDSIDLDIENFRDFPKALEKIENLKDKKIITFCTGGIRCEKATAYMQENGFNNVYQLKDGILNYGKKFPDTYWKGKCFVFDKRLITELNKKEKKALTKCETCEENSDLYRNCRNLQCDKLYTQCVPCQDTFNGCCSSECFEKFREHCMVRGLKNRQNMNSQKV